MNSNSQPIRRGKLMYYVPNFIELAGNEDEFFRDQFGKNPYLHRGALRNPSEVLSSSDLHATLRDQIVRAQHLTIALAGRAVEQEAYSQPMHIDGEGFVGRVISEKVSAHIREGATIIWRHVHLLRENIGRSREMMVEALGVECDTYAFLTPPGFRGIPIHDDPDDVFALQLEGCKRWKVWRAQGNPRAQAKLYNASEIQDLGEPLVDVVLMPGDFLYIPRHAAHETLAVNGDTASLHVTATARIEMWSQILISVVRRVVQENSEFADLPHFAATGKPCRVEDLQKKIENLIASLERLDIDREIDYLISESKTSKDPALGQRAAQA
ncbi:JmjC domain-containing protein [Streptomyces sp. NPDC055109]